MSSSIALGTYNPSQVPKDILRAEFTARQDMLSDLLSTIRSNEPGQPCQHSLLIGPRGFGKTTSLFALKYNVEDDAELRKTWVPLLFDEENYQIADLTGFWLECLRLTENALNVTSDKRYAELSISRDSNLEAIARDAFLVVLENHKKRALLLIDNLNDIFSIVNNKDEHHRLRAFLLEESCVCIIGTASSYFEAIQDVDQPFYNLFRIFRLDRFTIDELQTALEAMWKARSIGEQHFPPISKGYWKGLHILTGGNPRLVKMIFQLMEQGVTSDFSSQLEGLLDAYTPYFKHRIEMMSPQQRRVFDAIAMAWDPVPLGDIAPALRMDSNQVSAQVRSLTDAHLISVAGGTTKRRRYQIADRFSNIYYFMRYSRAGRSRFEWFVLTMKAILTEDQYIKQLDRMRKQGLACNNESDRFRHIHLIAAATCAIEDVSERRKEGHKTILSFLTNQQGSSVRQLLDEPSMRKALDDDFAMVEFFTKLPAMQREEINYQPENALWWYRLTDFAEERSLWSLAEQAYRKAIELDPVAASPWNALGNLLKNHLNRFDEAEAAYRTSIELDPSYPFPWQGLGNLLTDYLGRFDEAEAAFRKAIELDPSAAVPWYSLGNLLANYFDRSEEAETAFRRAIELDPVAPASWNCLGNLIKNHSDRFDEAEAAYRKSIELDPSYAVPWNGLGNLFRDHLHNFKEAEAAYRRSIELDPTHAIPWNGLGNLFKNYLDRFEEAEVVYRKAIELDPGFARPWCNLGNLLQDNLSRFEEAEEAYRTAIELDPTSAFSWCCLGALLEDNFGRFEEAEAAFRKAIELDPDNAFPWCDLGNLLQDHSDRFKEAEAALRKAIELDPIDSLSRCALGNLLQDRLGRFEEAEAVFLEAIELDPTSGFPWFDLGNLLKDHLNRFEEAATAYRKAIELDPKFFAPWSALGDLLKDNLNCLEEAEATFRQALNNFPTNTYLKSQLANLLFDVNRNEEERVSLIQDAVITSPESDWIRYLFKKIAISVPDAVTKALYAISERLVDSPPLKSNSHISKSDLTLDLYRFSLECIQSLIRRGYAEKAVATIAQVDAREIFDIPLQAIEVIKNPGTRQKLAAERLALVEEFIKQIETPLK